MNMQPINLSYFLTTYQKLSYLKILLEDLIASREADEEIVISDGGSTDGTIEYLQQLYTEGKIQHFFSGKDKGESHGINRAMIACKGTILKVLTDDDVYCFEAIKECKEYLLLNPEVDMIGADGYDNYIGTEIEFINHQRLFYKWRETKEPFGFYGPGFFIRRSSIPLLGLFSCIVKFIDTEYAYRATSLPIKLTWYKKPVFVRIINKDSNTLKFLKRLKLERQLFNLYVKFATGISIGTLQRGMLVNAAKRKVYDIIYKRSSAIRKDKYSGDIYTTYMKYREALIASFKANTEEPFVN